jgi:hypothetical protein
MLKRMVLGLFVALLPSVALAQAKQEDYLPAKSQLYFRWDGMEKHQAAYDKTAIGKTMQGDTGKFLDELWKFTHDNLQAAAQNEPKIGPLLKDLTKVIVNMHKNGLVFAVEVDTVIPPMVQAVLVFPKGAGESGTLLPLIQKIAEETKAKVNSAKVGKRFVHTVEIEMVKLGWWAQGNDAVVFLGTTDPVAFAKDIDAKKTGITKNPLYVKVNSFKDFETASRGYFDVTSVLKVAADIAPPAEKIIDEIGLKGLKSITFVSGFEGPAERSVVEADVSGPRKGLLSLASTKKISLKDLPVLPNDLTGFSAGSANLSKSYDVITSLIVGVMSVAAPNEVDNVKDAIKAFEGAIGVDINKDLFGNFGDVVVSYSSPSDGFLGTGAVVAVQIKDGKKMSATIEKLMKAIPAIPGGEITMKKKMYHGGEIMQLGMSNPQFTNHFATIGIYKNWFIYAQYPTPIKGFILRQEGELPAWKADESLTKVLSEFPSEFNSIQVSDPRPTVQTLLSVAPFALNLANTFGGMGFQFFGAQYRPFDLDLIPHPQEAVRHLFPNVTVSTDDGKRVRSETRGSLLLPF